MAIFLIEEKAKQKRQLSILARYWSNVKVAEPDECWPWKASFRRDGYGQMMVNYRKYGTHRLAWLLAKGTIPEGLFVCHKCDNKACCNPNHLFLGTQEDNFNDMVQKGRQARGESLGNRIRANAPRGDRNGLRLHPESVPRGELSGTHKLKEWQVLEIRRVYKQKSSTMQTLADKYEVSITEVFRIIHRRRWCHI
jgi:hypothetical protein